MADLKELIRTLNGSDNEKERASAVEALGWNKDKKAIKPVLKALEDDSALVRKTAVWACARLEIKKAIPQLEAFIEDPYEEFIVQKAAIEALQDLEEKDSTIVLLKALRGENLLFIDLVAKALGAKGLPVLPPLLDLLVGENALHRQNAAKAISHCKDDPIPPLVEKYWSLLPATRLLLVETFGELGGPIAVKLLLIATHDEEFTVQTNIATRAKYLLRKMDIIGLKDVLFVYLDLPEKYAVNPINLIPELWGERAIEPLLEEYPLLDGDPKDAAEQILGWYAGKSIDAVVDRLILEDEITAEAMSQLLGVLAPRAPTLNPVLKHAVSSDPVIRESVAEALGKISSEDPALLGTLGSLLEDASPEVRQKAARALGDLKHPDAIAPLIRHLQDPDEKTRLAVVAALTQFDPSLANLTPEDVFNKVVGR